VELLVKHGAAVNAFVASGAAFDHGPIRDMASVIGFPPPAAVSVTHSPLAMALWSVPPREELARMLVQQFGADVNMAVPMIQSDDGSDTLIDGDFATHWDWHVRLAESMFSPQSNASNAAATVASSSDTTSLCASSSSCPITSTRPKTTGGSSTIRTVTPSLLMSRFSFASIYHSSPAASTSSPAHHPVATPSPLSMSQPASSQQATNALQPQAVALPALRSESSDDSYMPLLHQAALHGRDTIVRILVGLGANVALPTTHWRYLKCAPLHLAADGGHEPAVRELIFAPGGGGIDVNQRDSANRTPLHYASERGHGNIVRLLIFSKGDLNPKRKPNGDTPLHMAAREGKNLAVSMLIENGADWRILNAEQRSALSLACQLYTELTAMFTTPNSPAKADEFLDLSPNRATPSSSSSNAAASSSNKTVVPRNVPASFLFSSTSSLPYPSQPHAPLPRLRSLFGGVTPPPGPVRHASAPIVRPAAAESFNRLKIEGRIASAKAILATGAPDKSSWLWALAQQNTAAIEAMLDCTGGFLDMRGWVTNPIILAHCENNQRALRPATHILSDPLLMIEHAMPSLSQLLDKLISLDLSCNQLSHLSPILTSFTRLQSLNLAENSLKFSNSLSSFYPTSFSRASQSAAHHDAALVSLLSPLSPSSSSSSSSTPTSVDPVSSTASLVGSPPTSSAITTTATLGNHVPGASSVLSSTLDSDSSIDSFCFIHPDWIPHLPPSLTTLNLSRNELSSFPDEFVSRLQLLTSLSLQENKLTAIPRNLLFMEHLRELAFAGNPLHNAAEARIAANPNSLIKIREYLEDMLQDEGDYHAQVLLFTLIILPQQQLH